MAFVRFRQSFPGENPQDIRCPECGGQARTSDDGIIWYCEAKHTGYYEQPVGVIVPDDKWVIIDG